MFTLPSSELRGRVSELERNLSTQEKEICSQASKLQELQTQLNQARKELTERDRDLTKASHELRQATDRHQQVEAKVGFLYWYIETLLIRDILFMFYFCFITQFIVVTMGKEKHNKICKFTDNNCAYCS